MTNVVEGSVRRAGSRLRITVQLVEVANGHHLWSERFDRDLADVFAIQDEIARTIAARLRPAAATTDVPRVGPPTRSLEAYEAYLRGRFYWDKGTRNDYGRAVQQLERAIVLDPEYARAYACLAEILCESTIYFGGPEEQPGRAKAHALRAIELDPGHGDAHAILGYVRFWFDWEWSEALEALERAVRLNPGSATAHNCYSVVLATLWGAERAIELCRRAIQLDPLWVNARQSLQWAFYQAGRYDEAITAGSKPSN